MALALPIILGAGAVSLSYQMHLGAMLSVRHGTVPSVGGPDQEYVQRDTFVRLRGGWINTAKYTHFGSQTGIEYDVRAGATTMEQVSDGPASPWRASATGSLGVPIRFAAWTSPFLGAVELHLNVEGGTGGHHWWAHFGRLSPLLGVRTSMEAFDALALELDYTWVPLVVTRRPDGFPLVRRQEHRGLVSLGYHSFGVGLELVYSRENASFVESPIPRDATTSSFTLSALVEVRCP